MMALTTTIREVEKQKSSWCNEACHYTVKELGVLVHAWILEHIATSTHNDPDDEVLHTSGAWCSMAVGNPTPSAVLDAQSEKRQLFLLPHYNLQQLWHIAHVMGQHVAAHTTKTRDGIFECKMAGASQRWLSMLESLDLDIGAAHRAGPIMPDPVRTHEDMMGITQYSIPNEHGTPHGRQIADEHFTESFEDSSQIFSDHSPHSSADFYSSSNWADGEFHEDLYEYVAPYSMSCQPSEVPQDSQSDS